jgi:DNA-binding beta-propeller fold protein YncE
MCASSRIACGAVLALGSLAAGTSASAQVAVSANDSKMKLVDGVNTPVSNPPPDTVTIIDLSGAQPKVVAELKVPASVIGPPSSVAVAPDRSLALVTASTKLDPTDPKKTAYDNKVSVIDLQATPPTVTATLQAGSGASGVSINRAGTLALVANRFEGTLSVFTIRGKTVTASGKVDLQAPDSQPSAIAFSRDGRTALVTRNNDHLISLLAIDGDKVTYAKRDLAANLKPYGIEVTPGGDVAVVAGTGAGASGGTDTVSVIDLTLDPPRAVDQASVGPIAEGVAVSPDGRYVAVTIINGSNNPKASPLYRDSGMVRVLSLANKKLTMVAEAKTGRWCQGVAWSPNGRTLLVQVMVDNEIQTFNFDGKTLTPGPAIKVSGGPAGIASSR